jgi:hypothetical protein
MLRARGLIPAERNLRDLGAQVLDQRAHARFVGAEFLRTRIELAADGRH